MTFYTKIGSLSKPTSGTVPLSQDSVTVSETPKGVIFWWGGTWQSNTGAAGTYTEHASAGMGFSDGTNHRSYIMEMEDNGASSGSGGWMGDGCISFGEDTLDERATCSFSSTKFTLSWTKITAQAATIYYMVFGGTDITNVTVGDFAAGTATGNSTTSGTSFTPDIEFYLTTDKTTTNTFFSTNSPFSLGAAMSSSKQWNIANACESGRATMDTWRYLNTGQCVGSLTGNSGALRNAGTFVAFTSTGRTINWTTTDGTATKVYFMAIKGGQWDMGSTAVTSGTGTFTPVTSMSFAPTSMLFAGNGVATSTTVSETEDRFTFCGMESTTARNTYAYADADNTAAAQVVSVVLTSSVYRMFSAAATATSSTTHVDIDISTLNSNGFTLNKVTNTGSTVVTPLLLWVGMAANAGGGGATATTVTSKTVTNKFITQYP